MEKKLKDKPVVFEGLLVGAAAAFDFRVELAVPLPLRVVAGADEVCKKLDCTVDPELVGYDLGGGHTFLWDGRVF